MFRLGNYVAGKYEIRHFIKSLDIYNKYFIKMLNTRQVRQSMKVSNLICLSQPVHLLRTVQFSAANQETFVEKIEVMIGANLAMYSILVRVAV